MKTLHIHRVGVRTFCGLIRPIYETTLAKYFNKEGDKCKSCAAAMTRAGYNLKALEFRFSNKEEGKATQ